MWGAKRGTEADACVVMPHMGRGAFRMGRSQVVKSGGPYGSENDGMSSVRQV